MNKKTVIQTSGAASAGMQSTIRNARNGTGGFI
jgi:hypothetical protein